MITSRHTYPGEYVEYYRQMNPSEITDLYHDPRFVRRFTVGSKNMYDIFSSSMDGTSRPASGGISIREATYGASCAGIAVPSSGGTGAVRRGNVTRALARACNGRAECNLTISSQALGDPAPFCAKDFSFEWTCRDGRSGQLVVPAEASGTAISLRCDSARRLRRR